MGEVAILQSDQVELRKCHLSKDLTALSSTFSEYFFLCGKGKRIRELEKGWSKHHRDEQAPVTIKLLEYG